jgi:hypothetical protein
VTIVGEPMADTWARLGDLALSLPGAWEDFPWGERVAKVDKKIFVFFGHADGTGPAPTSRPIVSRSAASISSYVSGTISGTTRA